MYSKAKDLITYVYMYKADKTPMPQDTMYPSFIVHL